MAEREDGGPAFPVVNAPGAPEDYPGMSLRDYYAGQALIALGPTLAKDPDYWHPRGAEIAKACYSMAGHMLNARQA